MNIKNTRIKNASIHGPAAARVCLYWCLWPMLPPKITQMPGVWVTTCGHESVPGPCYCWGHTILLASAATPGHRDIWTRAACRGPCLSLWSYCSSGLWWFSWPVLAQVVIRIIQCSTRPVLHSPWDIWPYLLVGYLSRRADANSQVRAVLPLSPEPGKDGSTLTTHMHLTWAAH